MPETDDKLFDMVRRFLEYIKLERGYSPNTVTSYGDDLEGFEKFFTELEGSVTWQTVDSDVVRMWMEKLMESGYTASSVNRKLSALRSFYKFALKRNLLSKDPVHMLTGPKKHKPLPVYVKEKDMDALLDDAMWTDGYEDVLERTIITTFYETGIRLAELIGIDDSDVRLEQRELRVLGKRNKERVIPFGESLEETFNTYIQARDSEVTRKDSAFFSNTKGRRVSRGQVMTMVRRQLSRVTTQKKRSPHVLRHTFATAMLNNDANIESLKKLLGHESVATTARYAHTTFEQLKRVYKNAHPRA